MTGQDAKHRLAIANDLTEIARVIEVFESFAQACAIPAATAGRFNVVFEELLSNIIHYAYGDREPHEIGICMQRQGERLSVTITDDGIPFDPLSKPPPDIALPVEEREIGGLGIHLVRNLVQDAHYRREDGRNITTLIQSLN